MSPDDRAKRIAQIREYHRATRHHFQSYARGPAGLDWENQPDPFRRYRGAPLLALDHARLEQGPSYADVFGGGSVPLARVDRSSISRFFEDSLALSAWKQVGETCWSLRVDPSSGNLHPTEGYLLSGPVEGLTRVPWLAHYAPREHALEARGEIPRPAWAELSRGLPADAFFLGIASIHWREAWKYGERAFRYCQHDAGHVLACFAIAAAGLGWKIAVCEDLGHEDLRALLGLGDPHGAEVEEPECLLAVIPRSEMPALPTSAPAELDGMNLQGEPNVLSSDQVEWSAVDFAAESSRKPRTQGVFRSERKVAELPRVSLRGGDLPLRRIVHGRRSAVAFDGKTTIARDDFYRVLASTCRGPARSLPWSPRVHFGLFVHRVAGLEPGLYALARDPEAVPLLRASMERPFLWQKPEGVPAGLELFRLSAGDVRSIARAVSCHQEIASDGSFSLAMLTEFDPALTLHGAWFYRRLFWECGAVGQVLYLEAEAIGVRATGIGCFFDEPAHEVFGISTGRFRSLYHFTVGGPVDDPRLQTWPAYPPRDAGPDLPHHADP